MADKESTSEPGSSDVEFTADPRIALDVMRDRLRFQLQAVDSVDAKAGGIFTIGSALIGLLVAIFSLRDELGVAEYAILSVAVAAYVTVVLCSFTAWPREWQIGPDPTWTWESSQQLTDGEMLPQLISGYVDNWSNNAEYVATKLRALRVGFVAVAVLAAALIAGLVAISVAQSPGVVVGDQEVDHSSGQCLGEEVEALDEAAFLCQCARQSLVSPSESSLRSSGGVVTTIRRPGGKVAV